MNSSTRRITLIHTASTSSRTWDRSVQCPSRCIAVPSFNTLRHALRSGVTELGQDVERVILDGQATATQFLDLVASLPEAFSGDVMLVREDGTAYVNAAGRGDGRVMYSLAPRDVNFYLEVHGLLENGRLQVVAPQPQFLQLAAA
ncbi:MAG: hypothetical protein ABIP63_00590 [Thermoanaerobaculia bacterium]